MKVPFFDLKQQTLALLPELNASLGEVLENTAFASGSFVERFEESFAAYCEVEHAVGVGSGTEALWLALLALGIGRDDEVITAANTFVATVEAIYFVGAKPVLVDVEDESYNLDPAQLEAAITPRTKAIMPVHLFGQMADMQPILEIAERHGLPVIEDASQAHGARDRGASAGSLGQAGCFSFYPGKNLGACGDAGALVSNDAELVHRVRMLRDHGQSEKYCHEVVGWNARMDGFQGAALDVKLRHLEAWTERRRNLAAQYRNALADEPAIHLPPERDDVRHVYHLFVVRVDDRDGVRAELEERGIGTGIHYPIPVHLQKAFAYLGHVEGDFPCAEKTCREFVSLPLFPELSDDQLACVCRHLKEVVQTRRCVPGT